MTAWGRVVPWDGSAAAGRGTSRPTTGGTTPASTPAVRQPAVDGTAVFETKLRIPGGDAVQRVWSVADAGGYTLVEVTQRLAAPDRRPRSPAPTC